MKGLHRNLEESKRNKEIGRENNKRGSCNNRDPNRAPRSKWNYTKLKTVIHTSYCDVDGERE